MTKLYLFVFGVMVVLSQQRVAVQDLMGTWQGVLRANGQTAWTIPADPRDAPKMASDVVPTYEVATIKPSRPDEGNRALFRQGRRFNTTATSIVDLMMFAYGIHFKQIANAPRWLENDKYDVTLLPAGEGQPSDGQLKEIMRKLLSDRLRLTLHRENRALSVYRIVTLKAGRKFVNSLNPDGPAGVGNGVGVITVKSATMADFAGFLQRYHAMDRPVIDRTGLSGRYDFTLRWTPDDRPKTGDLTDEFPDFFAAIQQQLGLKLETATESVD